MFGRAIAADFVSYAVRMTYSGSYKHTGRLSGGPFLTILSGGRFTCDGERKQSLLRCHQKHCNAVRSNQTIVLHLLRLMLDSRLYIPSNHPHWKLFEIRRHLTAALRTHCMKSYLSDFKVLNTSFSIRSDTPDV